MAATLTNHALYRWMTSKGATDAEAAAASSIDVSSLATKADLNELALRLELRMAEMESRLGWKIVGTLMGMTGIFGLFVGWMTWILKA